MLLYLVSFFPPFHGERLLHYITFRACCAFITSAVLMFIFTPRFIRFLQGKRGQPIRLDGPQTHLKKHGTPTMGGVMVILASVIGALLWGRLGNVYFWLLLAIMLLYGAIGFYDDYLKVSQQNDKGFSGRRRLILEALIAAAIAFIIERCGGTDLGIPFLKNYVIDLGWFFIPFAVFVIVGAGNAVNFTDGLDGLAIGTVMITALSFAIIAYVSGNHIFAEYLQISFTAGVGEAVVLLGAVLGASLGFLWFNAPPAQIFMGDTGALALGGLLGVVAVVTKHELVLAIIGGIFVIEAVSVILQVGSYKLRGKRIFLMAPLHHHFEKKNWSESQVVIRFWILSIIFALIGLTTLKLH